MFKINLSSLSDNLKRFSIVFALTAPLSSWSGQRVEPLLLISVSLLAISWNKVAIFNRFFLVLSPTLLFKNCLVSLFKLRSAFSRLSNTERVCLKTFSLVFFFFFFLYFFFFFFIFFIFFIKKKKKKEGGRGGGGGRT